MRPRARRAGALKKRSARARSASTRPACRNRPRRRPGACAWPRLWVRQHDRRAVGGEVARSAPRPRAWRAGSRLAVGSSRNSTLGLQRPGARQREALLLAAGQHARRCAARARRGPTRAQRLRARCSRARARRTPREPRARAHVGQRREAQHARPLEHHRLARGARRGRATRCAPAVGASRPCSSAQQHALAGAVGADDRDARARRRSRRSTPSMQRVRRAEAHGRRRCEHRQRRSAASRSRHGGAARPPCAARSAARVQREHERRAARCRAPSASGRSPLLVSSAIAVVITRVTPSMLPPTIITAPTSERGAPEAGEHHGEQREAHVPEQRERGARSAARRASAAARDTRATHWTSWRVYACSIM